ncbi:MAG TPA: YedE family putative selenium transporter [Coriobacteriia bacterium]|nr:YedE family putative selenium transporter [Coriobacteriia bacterium]
MAKRRVIGPTAWYVGGAGLFIGALAGWLVSQGNPGNMGLCIACFWRDIAGFFAGGVTNQAAVAYIRPEIIGIILGALGASIVTKEFKPRGGSSTLLRFLLGFIFMSSALVFLGCTVRAWVRLGGGDLTALWGLLGIIIGVVVGVVVLKSGYNLGRAKGLPTWTGWIVPAIGVILLVFALITAYGGKPGFATLTPANGKAVVPGEVVVTTDGTVIKPADATLVDGAVVAADGTVLADAEKVAATKPMPGGKRAPLFISLVAGLAIGVVAQRSRFCSVGGIRDSILIKRYDLLFGVIGLVIGATIVNLIFGQYNLGFEGQPVAHNDVLGNIAAMVVAALSAVMLGGCPMRQMIMGSEGDADGAAAVVGMIVGAGFTHWAGIASSPAGLTSAAWPALAIYAVILAAIALMKRVRMA